jgi:Ca-activated chloride channel family protein
MKHAGVMLSVRMKFARAVPHAWVNSTGSPFILLGLIALLLCSLLNPVLADSPRKLVAQGNRSYGREEYERAVEYYEKASVRAPESPIVAFNMGNAFYRKDEFAAAREHYGKAALKAENLSLEAKAWYNTGNCAFREGERQVDSDLEKALEFFEESVQLYTTALEKDPGLADAAHNIEVARLIIKDLLDKIKNQQEQKEQQQKRLQAIADSLRALIDRQEQAAAASRELEGAPDKGTERWRDDLGRVEERQKHIADGTAAVQDSLHAMFPDSIPQPVEEASSHLDSSLVNQDGALNGLEAQQPGRAAEDQDISLDQLQKALDALTEDQQGSQQQQDRQEEREQQQQPQQEQPEEPLDQEQREQQKQRNETAQGILDEEKENKKKRQKATQSYRPVDKDW